MMNLGVWILGVWESICWTREKSDIVQLESVNLVCSEKMDFLGSVQAAMIPSREGNRDCKDDDANRNKFAVKREVDWTFGPFGEDEGFYDCESQDTVSSTANATLRNGLSKLDLDAQPMFSSMASPRGVRRRLKSFFWTHAPFDLGRTESLVEILRKGEMSEDQLFEELKGQYGLLSSRSPMLTHLLVDECDLFPGEETGEIEETKEEEEEGEDDSELKSCLSTISSEATLHEEDLEDFEPESRLRFCDKVEIIRTSFSGEFLGGGSAPLQKPHHCIHRNDITPDAKKITPRNKDKKKKKRNIKRLSIQEKLELYAWREDLKPQKLIEKEEKFRQQQLHSLQQPEIGELLLQKPAIPPRPPKELLKIDDSVLKLQRAIADAQNLEKKLVVPKKVHNKDKTSKSWKIFRTARPTGLLSSVQSEHEISRSSDEGDEQQNFAAV